MERKKKKVSMKDLCLTHQSFVDRMWPRGQRLPNHGFNGAKVFTKLHLVKVYYLISVNEEVRQKKDFSEILTSCKCLLA